MHHHLETTPKKQCIGSALSSFILNLLSWNKSATFHCPILTRHQRLAQFFYSSTTHILASTYDPFISLLLDKLASHTYKLLCTFSPLLRSCSWFPLSSFRCTVFPLVLEGVLIDGRTFTPQSIDINDMYYRRRPKNPNGVEYMASDVGKFASIRVNLVLLCSTLYSYS